MSLVLENPNIPADVKAPRDEDVARMKQVIEADALLVSGQLVCAAAGHCAMGSLLFATGMSNARLAEEASTPTEFSKEAAQRLYDYYRCGHALAERIVTVNDAVAGYARTEHAESDLDPELQAMNVQRLLAPTDDEIARRKQRVIETIEEGVAYERLMGDESLWPQLHQFVPVNDDDLAF